MPIYEYICEDCQTEFEKIVINRAAGDHLPEVRRDEEQDSAFGVCDGQWQRRLVERTIVFGWRRRRLLRRRLRLQLRSSGTRA